MIPTTGYRLSTIDSSLFSKLHPQPSRRRDVAGPGVEVGPVVGAFDDDPVALAEGEVAIHARGEAVVGLVHSSALLAVEARAGEEAGRPEGLGEAVVDQAFDVLDLAVEVLSGRGGGDLGGGGGGGDGWGGGDEGQHSIPLPRFDFGTGARPPHDGGRDPL